MSVSEIEAFPAELSARKHPTAWSDVAFECPAALRGLRVLVVEDESDGRRLMAAILGRCNAEVLTVGSAAEALNVLDRIQLDVLISDIEMPGEDGYSLIRKLRAKENSLNGRIPAAALTAHAAVTDRMRALSAGFDIHLPKPVEPAELVAVIASLASRVRQNR
jgi:CheY-like chemotaxis protein